MHCLSRAQICFEFWVKPGFNNRPLKFCILKLNLQLYYKIRLRDYASVYTVPDSLGHDIQLA